MIAKPRFSILFVCLGNICRSPLAEGVFRAVVEERGRAGEFEIDSAGTGGWHEGEPPDPRSIAIARLHGIDITGQRARQLRSSDFDRFTLLVGMDRANERTLRERAPQEAHHKIHLFLELAAKEDGVRDVPDPYYGGEDHFAEVYQMIREASEALVTRL